MLPVSSLASERTVTTRRRKPQDIVLFVLFWYPRPLIAHIGFAISPHEMEDNYRIDTDARGRGREKHTHTRPPHPRFVPYQVKAPFIAYFLLLSRRAIRGEIRIISTHSDCRATTQ
jgi:hypothetical protein